MTPVSQASRRRALSETLTSLELRNCNPSLWISQSGSAYLFAGWGTAVTEGKPDISERVVAHFPGFEPLNARQHHERYCHSAASSAAAFGISATVSALSHRKGAPSFVVNVSGSGFSTRTTLHLLDHEVLIDRMAATSAHIRLIEAYAAAIQLICDGTFLRYLRASWRYALYFLFPFLAAPIFALAAASIAVGAIFAGLPERHVILFMPLCALAMFLAAVPLARRFHLSNLFDQWRLALRLAQNDQSGLAELSASHAEALETVLSAKADDHLVTAHSLGGVFAILALARLIEQKPEIIRGKVVTLCTLAGSGLQVSLIRQAATLREATRRVLECPNIYWLDYQCLADPVNLYGSKITREIARIDPQFSGLESPPVVTIRVKDMLEPAHYRRIRRDKLRLHRQFVLGSDRPYRYDFLSLTAGPYASPSFAAYNLGTAMAADTGMAGPSPAKESGAIAIAVQ